MGIHRFILLVSLYTWNFFLKNGGNVANVDEQMFEMHTAKDGLTSYTIWSITAGHKTDIWIYKPKKK